MNEGWGGVGGKGKDGGGTRKGAGVSQMADGSKIAAKPVQRIAPIGFRTGEEGGMMME